MKVKKIFSIFLALLVLITPLSLLAGAKVYDNEKLGAYISGYPDGTFRPDANMTRAEAVTLLFRLIDDEKNKKLPYVSKYPDVSKDDWFYPYVAYFESNKLLSDFPGSFAPNEYITRAQFTRLLVSILKPNEYSYKTFTDIENGHKYFEDISMAATTGLIAGYPDGSFRPDGHITRAEVVTVINRAIKRRSTNNDGKVGFSDISLHWAKYEIIAAANEMQNGDAVIWETASDDFVYEIPENSTYTENVDRLFGDYGTLTSKQFVNAVDTVGDARKEEIISFGNGTNITASEGATTYYVSNGGNDENDGLSPESAWATLTKVNSMQFAAGDVILFRRGDLFRGQLYVSCPVTYSAYGTGDKPRIYNSKKDYGADEDIWVETEKENVYLLKDRIMNVGIIALDHSHVIGDNEGTVGAKVMSSKDALTTDLQYYSDLDSGELYFYSKDGNPGSRFKSIEIGDNTHIVRIVNSGARIDNLCLSYTGAHGVKGNSGIGMTVTNCAIGWVGGSELSPGTQYGNAIEIYGGCANYHSEDNYIWQCFDTGITIQCALDGVCKQIDVTMKRNVIDNCFWGVEFYNSGADPDGRKISKDFDISYNIIRYTGYGWGRGSFGDAYQSCGMTDNIENYKVYKNIFRSSNGNGTLLHLLPGGDEKIEFSDNIYIQQKSKKLGSYAGKNYLFDSNCLETLKTTMHQQNPLIVFSEYSK